MKKSLFLLALVVFAVGSMSAQGNLSAGISLGLPIGYAGDGWNFNTTLDVNYLWEVGENFKAGIATGYSHFFGEQGAGYEIDDIQYFLIAGSARFVISNKFTLGMDLGYAIESGDDGGIYYAPRVQYGISESIDIVAAYRGISYIIDTYSMNAMTLGVEFGL